MGSRPTARLLLVACAGLSSLSADDALETPPRITASFLQLWADHGNWPGQRWDTLFDHLEKLGIREIYVQWSQYDEHSYFAPANSANNGKTSPVAAILRRAADRGMGVHLGLSFHSGFWQNAKPGAALGPYLAEQRRRSIQTAEELSRRYGADGAFRGWYISEELDDLMWPAGEARNLLLDHLTELSSVLERLTPRRPVTISGYSGARTDPAQLAAFWQSILERTRIATVMFQDGIGVGNLPLAYVRQYLEAMRAAVTRNDRELKVIVEVFRQVDGEFNGRPFRAIPAPFAFVLPQIQAAAAYSPGGMVAFSVPEYMTPLGGIEAEQTYLSYLDWVKATGGGQAHVSLRR